MLMRHFVLSAAFGVSCAVVLGATQGGSAAQAPAVMKPGVAHIAGKVVEAGTTTGVGNAIVTLSGSALGPPTAMFANGVPGGPRRITSDARGQFLFRDLPPGLYAMTSTAAGYVTGAYGQRRITQFPRPLDVVHSLELTDADGVVTVAIEMSKNGGIGGTVIDEAGEPMVGVPITVLTRITEWGVPVMRIAADVTTDDRGMYHADVAPGEYIVGLIAATTTVPASAVDGFQQAQREGGATMQTYMDQVVASGSLLPRGVGARVDNFIVSQLGRLNTWVVPPFTSRDGRSFFYPTTFHPSSLSGASASVVTVASGVEKTGVDVHVRSVPARRVSGRVVAANGPVAGIALRLIARDSSASDAGIWFVGGDTSNALTDGNGEFTFLGIAPGLYTVRVLRATTPADSVLWAADSITVGAEGDLADLTVRLRAGATIGGRVVVEGRGAPLSPTALRAIMIRPTPMPGSAGALMGPIGWVVRPDENARFTTGQMVPGPYVVSITALPSGWVLKSVTTGGQSAIDKSFDLTTAGITDVVVTITDGVSSLGGTARDSDSKAAPGATVVLFPANKSQWVIPGTISGRVRTAAPGRDGRYTFSGLPSGEYFVVAADAPTADFSDSQVWTTLIASASRVTISDGESRTQDLRVVVMR